jgi:uncharacterized Zn-finger protein
MGQHCSFPPRNLEVLVLTFRPHPPPFRCGGILYRILYARPQRVWLTLGESKEATCPNGTRFDFATGTLLC